MKFIYLHRNQEFVMSKAERTKQFIIEKTAPIFNAKGYAGTSISDLMEATGLTKGSIYGNFENKDEVAIAAFEYNFQKIVTLVRSQMENKTTVIDRLLVYPEIYRNFLTNPILASGCPVTNTSTEADDTHPMLRAKVEEAYHFWKGSLENHLFHGMEIGEVRKNLNVNEFISVFISIIQGGIIQAKVTQRTTSLNYSMDYLEKLIKDISV